MDIAFHKCVWTESMVYPIVKWLLLELNRYIRTENREQWMLSLLVVKWFARRWKWRKVASGQVYIRFGCLPYFLVFKMKRTDKLSFLSYMNILLCWRHMRKRKQQKDYLLYLCKIEEHNSIWLIIHHSFETVLFRIKMENSSELRIVRSQN